MHQNSNQSVFSKTRHHQNHPSFSRSRLNSHISPIIMNNHSLSVQTCIYGTNIAAKKVYDNLETFVLDFQLLRQGESQDQVPEKIYYTKLTQLDLLEKNIFQIEGKHLKQYDQELYFQFIYFPTQMLTIFDDVIRNLYDRLFVTVLQDGNQKLSKMEKRNRITVVICSLTQSTALRDMNHEKINRLLSIKGIVIRCSQISPQMVTATFRCLNCSNTLFVALSNATISQPKGCNVCKLKDTLSIVHNECQFADRQFVKFQQLPEYVPQGQTPSSVTLVAYDYSVDGLRPGDRVQIVGIYRIQNSKIQINKKSLRTVYNTYVDLISFGRIQDKSFKIIDENIHQVIYNDDDKNVFAKMADSPNVINDLIRSFAPSIYGNQQVKKGLLAQLFGGTKKDFSTLGRARFRSDINICLVGDPSTAKSQLLQQVHKISPRGIYTSGRGSSAVGLTANVRKDPETKQFILESGALVLSDLGICCIDQFDKMDPHSRLILLEAMEQQTISIAKAGIVCQLNSRAAILCAANPLNSKYNPKKSVVQNINLQPALLSRFDLIYIILDQPNQTIDKMLATHILNLYSELQSKLNLNENNAYSKEILTKYITYAKQYVHPVLNQESADKLVQAYSDMRKLGNNKKIITATTRQLQSLIRVSEAFAKMRLSNLVQQRDVDQAIALVKFATQQAATDPTTGLIDMDVIVTGRTAATRRKINRIKDIAFEILKANVSKYKKNSTVQGIKIEIDKKMEINQRTTEEEVLQALKLLETEGVVSLFGQSKTRPNFKLARDMQNL